MRVKCTKSVQLDANSDRLKIQGVPPQIEFGTPLILACPSQLILVYCISEEPKANHAEEEQEAKTSEPEKPVAVAASAQLDASHTTAYVQRPPLPSPLSSVSTQPLPTPSTPTPFQFSRSTSYELSQHGHGV